MAEKQVILNFHDFFRFENIEEILDKVREILDEIGVKTVIKKKVFNVMVECLENIHKYSAMGVNDNTTEKEYLPNISVEMDDEGFTLLFENVILNEKINSVASKIEEVNSLDKQGLKILYEEKINNTEISDKGGAGLGTILSAMISGNKLKYNFKKMDDIYSYFSLTITILNLKS